MYGSCCQPETYTYSQKYVNFDEGSITGRLRKFRIFLKLSGGKLQRRDRPKHLGTKMRNR